MGILLEKIKKCLEPRFLFLLIAPLFATFLLGSFFEKQQETLTVPIALVDEDQTEFSKAIIEEMRNQEMFNVLEVSMLEGKRLLERNEIDSLFILKSGFQERLLEEKEEETITLLTSSTSVASGIVQEVVASEVMKVSSAVMAANRVQRIYEKNGVENGFQWKDAYDYSMDQWEPSPLMTIDYVAENKGRDTKVEKTSILFSYLGIWGFFTMIVIFITCDWIVKERSILFSRMKTTYRGLSSYLRQTAGALFFLHGSQSILSFWLFSQFEKIERNMMSLVGMLSFIVFSLSLSLLLASHIRHLGSYYIGGVFVAFLLSLAGGSFVPVAELSPILGKISNRLPQMLLVSGADVKWQTLLLTLGVSWLLWRWSVWRLQVQ